MPRETIFLSMKSSWRGFLFLVFVLTAQAELWENTPEIEEGWKFSSWLGLFHSDSNGSGWIYHQDIGWLYAEGYRRVDLRRQLELLLRPSEKRRLEAAEKDGEEFNYLSALNATGIGGTGKRARLTGRMHEKVSNNGGVYITSENLIESLRSTGLSLVTSQSANARRSPGDSLCGEASISNTVPPRTRGAPGWTVAPGV